jgi:para-nitrobenzyl esterase
VAPWTQTRDATEFTPPCIQMDSSTTTDGSEDCLYLNVFAPASATRDARLPVMVHLHPGANFFFAP